MARLLVILLILFLVAPSPAIAEERVDEVRVLIDVSGSMRHTDPSNLRLPAMRLLVNLLPTGSKTAFWNFGGTVETLVAPATVDEQWREQALAASERIHSRGQWTDIGAALETALEGWEDSDGEHRRSIIMLTDGLIDVSPDPEEDERARADIIERLLPKLRDAQVPVHSIGLSNDIDHELLEKLSMHTDGSFSVAETAEQLQRIFLRMFERTVERETLPLENNRFRVDASVSELTLLAFRAEDAPPSALVTPDGERFQQQDVPDRVRWHHEQGYDLITITEPQIGEWQLLAAVDPDNRVMVVTDLRLQTTQLPAHIIEGESLELAIALTEQRGVVTREDFLDVLEVAVSQESDAATRQWALDHRGVDVRPADGTYRLELRQTLQPGEHIFQVQVDGKTFQREDRQYVKVHGDAVQLRHALLDTEDGYEVRVLPQLEWLNADTLRVRGEASTAEGLLREVAAEADEGLLSFSLSDLPAATAYRLDLELSGRAASGRPFVVRLPELELPGFGEPAAEQGANVSVVLIAVIVFNVMLFSAGGLIYYMLRTRTRRMPGFDNDGF